MKLLVCSLALIILGVGYPAPKHYLIETGDKTLKVDLKLENGKVVEKVREDVIDAIEGEKTYGEIIEKGKEDLKLSMSKDLKDKVSVSGEDYY